MKSPHRVHPHARVKLSKIPTSPSVPLTDKQADALVKKHREQLAALQEVLFASQSRAVLIVLQGMDTAGKDGTIRHIFSGINPQGCDVSSFKPPTPLEAKHDFLWRCQKRLPACGMIGIFNRSHYEDVLVPRVHGKLDEKVVRRRLREINDWEHTLAANGTVILKFYLHISRAEQTRRLQSRIDTPDKRWKLSPSDFAERAFWPRYKRRLRGDPPPHQPQARALVHHPLGRQVLPQRGHLHHPGRSPPRAQAEIPSTHLQRQGPEPQPTGRRRDLQKSRHPRRQSRHEVAASQSLSS
jgi:PPK2 family polyphosphate:nucleotide phosphotransferase